MLTEILYKVIPKLIPKKFKPVLMYKEKEYVQMEAGLRVLFTRAADERFEKLKKYVDKFISLPGEPLKPHLNAQQAQEMENLLDFHTLKWGGIRDLDQNSVPEFSREEFERLQRDYAQVNRYDFVEEMVEEVVNDFVQYTTEIEPLFFKKLREEGTQLEFYFRLLHPQREYAALSRSEQEQLKEEYLTQPWVLLYAPDAYCSAMAQSWAVGKEDYFYCLPLKIENQFKESVLPRLSFSQGDKASLVAKPSEELLDAVSVLYQPDGITLSQAVEAVQEA